MLDGELKVNQFLAAHFDDFAISHGDRLPDRESIVHHQDFAVMQEEIDMLRLHRC